MLRFVFMLAGLVAGVAVAGCAAHEPLPPASSPAHEAIAAGRCDATLAPRPAPSRVAPVPAALAPGAVPVDVAIDLARVVRSIEAEVPARILEEHDRDIGTPGRLSYVVDRGPLAVTVEGGRLVVRADLVAHAAVCKPIGILGCVTYASCEPTALASASLPAALTRDFGFGPSAVSVDVRRRCVVTALAIDVTPMLEARVRAEARRLQARIDHALPSLRPDAERLWAQLSRPIPLRDGAHASLDPRALLQAPAAAHVAAGALVLRFGVVAAPVVATEPSADGPPPPLPPLRDDPSLGETFALAGVVDVAPGALARDAAARLAGSTLEAGEGSVRVDSVQYAWSGERAAIDVAVRGPVCGDVSFDATPVWDASRHVLAFALAPAEGEEARVRAVAPSVDVARLARVLEPRLGYAPPVEDASLAAALENVAVPLGGGASLHVTLAPRPPGAPGGAVFARGQLRVALAGHAQIDVKSAP